MGTDANAGNDLSPLKKALLAIERLKNAKRSPVAIVGVGCRFPGGVTDLDSFWDLLAEGRDAISEVPADRWEVDDYYDADREAPGKMYVREGGFLDDVAGFDASFFGISPREATEMDPAQRLLLEVAWEALEHAGLPASSLERSRTGVYIGLGLSDYGRRHFLSDDASRLTPYSGTGSFLSVAAGRISYFLGLQGPAVTVDTACSSSLVSIHLAVQSLRTGESEVALAGGANLILSPEPSVYFSKLQALAADGRCKAFDASADGYARGEGAGVLVLKRLADAEAAGDRVLGVIRGTAVNQDGRSNGLTAPSGRAQQEVIRRALKNAGLEPGSVGFVEAHGTGTPLGDPIEFNALRAVYGGSGLAVGTVKTNFGHTETAAGVAGVIKVLLALRRRQIPPHLHLKAVNPRIQLGDLRIPTRLESWDSKRRIGGVSSFGLSGTNAHILIESHDEASGIEPPSSGTHVIALSAANGEGLRALAGRYAERLETASLADVAWSAARGRGALPERSVVVASSSSAAIAQLNAIESRRISSSMAPSVTFLFTGQGSQYAAMGGDLYEVEPVYRQAIDACAAILENHLDRPLLSILVSDDISATVYTQPGLFAVEYALAKLWESWGVTPDTVIGHSIGEYVAAHLAGVFSLEDGLRLVAARGRLMDALPRYGSMMAVFLPEAEVDVPDGLSVAAVNNPTETVLSGRSELIEALAARYVNEGVNHRKLNVSHAFHSALMDPMLEEFAAVAAAVTYRDPTCEVISNLDGGPATRLNDPGYWVEHVRATVRFADGMHTLKDAGNRVFVEIGPNPILSGMGARCFGDEPAHWLASLRDGKSDALQIRESLGALWTLGVPVDLAAAEPAGNRVDLPLYPWQRERFWMEPASPRVGTVRGVHGVRWRLAAADPEAPGSWAVRGGGDLGAAISSELNARGGTVSDDGDQVVDLRNLDSGDLRPIISDALKAQRRVWFVTRGIRGAALSGLGRVMAVEAPERWGGVVDIDGEVSAACIVNSLLSSGDFVRLRGLERRVARLVRTPTLDGGVEIRAGVAYLVTGGFGSLGRAVARWLVDRGATKLILTGRSGGAGAEDFIAALAVDVTAVAADVADSEAVAALFAEPVAGVIHAAGVNDDALMAEQSWARFEHVFAAKVRGADNLHAATKELDLDFFVLFSSAAAVLGTPGQANYAAANAHLDALAEYRRDLGLPAVSIGWGPWADSSMAASLGDSVRDRWARTGIVPLETDNALQLLGHALGSANPHLVIAPFDWGLYAESRPPISILAELAGVRQVAVAAQTGWTSELTSTPAAARRGALIDLLQPTVARILGFEPGQRLDGRQGFFDAGMDSLMAMELRNRLQSAVERPLSATLAFDHPNIGSLADHLLELLEFVDAPVEVPASRFSDPTEPIAIVGAACRFPAGANDLESYWALLRDGVDGVSEIGDRFDVDRYFDPAPATPGKLYSRWAGLLDEIETFDPRFFGMSPREAVGLDPQQRLLLEVSWQAFEDAGIAPASLEDSLTGVYVGIGASEYGRRFDPLEESGDVDAYSGTGNESSFAAGRISYVLGLRGPALAVNTACSSSLVSLHMAVQALRSGDCNVAVAGGVNAIVGPETTIQLSQLRALAPDGRCKTFDAAANGYVRGEGCGMVVLKRLSDAQTDGDRVLAVIRGTAINHDGRSSGLTVPNGSAQQQVIRAALAAADVQPAAVQYLECHGTGTVLGDPIEVRAIGNVLGKDRSKPLLLGSVKTNFGHLEAGAGIAGVLKVVLALQHEAIPPHLHFTEANPALPLDAFPLEIPTALTAWPRGNVPRFAGISAFGISGTNAHLILEEAPRAVEPARSAARPMTVVTVSGRTEEGLAAAADTLATHVESSDLELADVAFTANIGRSHLVWRTAVPVSTVSDLVSGLRARAIAAKHAENPKLAFLCTGAGPQVVGMARELYDADPVFRKALIRATEAANPHLDRPLLDVIYPAEGEGSPLNELAYTQPAMFAIEWAMSEMYASWGIRPDALIGHSTGQYIAACLAGVFDLEPGIALMAKRAALMSSLPHNGSMVAVFASEARVREAISGHLDAVGIAAVNGPEEAVISGLSGSVDAVADALEAAGIEIRRLRISHAAHSPCMDPILDEFEALVAATDMQTPRIPLIENVAGRVIGDEILDPKYWRRHMREGVQFYAGMKTLDELGYRHFLEIGNHPILCGAGARSLPDSDARWYPSLRRKNPEWPQLLDSLSRMHADGIEVDWTGFHAHQPGAKIALPPTSFQRERHWAERVERSSGPGAVGADWLYQLEWREVESAGNAEGKVLILADGGGVASLLAAELERPHAIGDVLADLDGVTTVVDLRALDGDQVSDAEDVCRRALELLLMVARSDLELVFVTRGARSVAGEAPTLAQAPIWGLAQVAVLDVPDLSCVRIDLDPAGGIEGLARILDRKTEEEQLALRGGQAHAPRLVRAQAGPQIEVSAGSYLVTGGLGALGLRVAEWLADQGATRVVLSGRSEPKPAAQAVIERITGAGCVVEVRRGDVSVAADCDAMLAGLDDLRGVVHAAGTLDDGSILNMDWQRFSGVWPAKVSGAWNLHLATADRDLDFFALFSSAASMIGSPGQSNYAAANAFMDALAHLRRSRGLPAVSMCWGPWADAGLATQTSRGWAAGGVHPLVPAHGVQVFGQLLAADSGQIAVANIDWELFGGRLVSIPRFLGDLIASREQEGASAILETLRRTPARGRVGIVEALVTGEVSGILGLKAGELDLDQGFFDAGMDSLMAVELVTRLKRALQVRLPATLAFDHGNVGDLSEFLLSHVLSLEDVASTEVREYSTADYAEPIAIIGMSCRFPGGSDNPEAFWKLLSKGVDPIREVPSDRWDLSALFDPTPATKGKMYTREAGFLDVVDQFDPEFFGIAPREANSMDPQQRLLLEVAWEALENAGKATAELKDSRTGVYVGVGDSGYLQRFQRPGEELYADTYAGTGSLPAFVSGRVAYALGLHGPNLALNTACSSSLVATHLAVQALRARECEMALTAGVHLMLSPENFVYVSQLKALSADGRCKTFDASADGYGRAEGCAVLALRRLSDAQADGDPILAVIRGSAVGHDGPSSGLTVPNGAAQQQVIRDAVANAGVDPLDVSYIEAHGTGTILGDPIEVHAVEATYCKGRTPDNPLHLGAVKASVGHMEVAAGVASLVKMVLALQERQIPPHLHYSTPNPDLDLEASNLRIDTALTPWENARRICGISGFGLAGTNAHIILEEAPPRRERADELGASERPAHVLALSAASPAAIRQLATRYAELLGSGLSLPDIAWSAHNTRKALPHRVAVTASDAAEAASRLSRFASDREAVGTRSGIAAARRPKVAFLFSGQGGQYPGMGRELYKSQPVYRDAIDRCGQILGPELIAVVHGSEEIHDTRWTQPGLFAVEYALYRLWESWGVTPDAVIGHSIGELVAACVAGVFSLHDGLRLVQARGALMSDLPRDGSMYAAFAEPSTVEAHLSDYPDVSIAAVNNPGETVISGGTESVEAVAEKLKASGVDGRVLNVSHAFHSPLMDPILDAFEERASEVTFSAPKLTLISNLSGTVAGAEVADSAYWRRHVREGVRFADGIRALEEMGYDVFVEMGPHPTLAGMGRRTLSELREALWLGSLKRDTDATLQILGSLGALFCRGLHVDWAGFDSPWSRSRTRLPNYPWQHRRYWMSDDEFPGRKRADSDWLYEVEWPIAPVQKRRQIAGRWVILADRGGVGDQLASKLRIGGATVEIYKTSDAFPDAAGIAAMVQGHVDGVVHLWSLDAPTEPMKAVRLGTMTAFHLVKALVEGDARCPLYLVTSGAVAVTGDDLKHPEQAPLWGFGRTARLEHRALDTRLVDCNTGDELAMLIGAVDDETEIAWRGERRVARLQRVRSAPVATPLTAEGTYLITGGLGALGLEAARWLVDHGARKLVLTGRSAAKPAAEEVLTSLRQTADVKVARGDVAVADDVSRILGEIPDLRGIVHAAGVLADGMIVGMSDEKFITPFGAKALGASNLHTLAGELDFFVMFSGGASLMGSPGQGNYSAANAYMDALAHYRRAAGLPALSINWGAWADIGMAAALGEKHRQRQASEGLHPLPVKRAMDQMGALLGYRGAQIAAMDVRWELFVDAFFQGSSPPFLRELVPKAPVAAAEPKKLTAGLPELLAALEMGDDASRHDIVDAFVHRKALQILDFDRDRQLDRERPLLELGLDSLLAVELKNAMMDGGVDVPVARVMTGPSIHQLNHMVMTVLEDLQPAIPETGETLEWAAARESAVQTNGAPPINPILSHALAAFGMAVFIIGGYLLGHVVFPDPQNLEDGEPVVQEEEPPPQIPPKFKRGPKGKSKKK